MSTIDLTGVLKPLRGTGSMEAASNLLRLDAPAGFSAGDRIIVEIGGEEGEGQCGTAGCGGVLAGNPEDGRYYNNQDVPQSLCATVLEVGADGCELILDAPAIAATEGASVHLDNTQLWHDATLWNEAKPVTMEEDVEVIIPPGSFAAQGQLPNTWHKGWTIRGAGKNETEFFAPKGVPTVFFRAGESPRTTLSDVRIRGNVGPHGFGVADWYPGAIGFSLSPDSVIRDVIAIDCWRALSIDYSHNTWAERVDAYLTEQLMHYVSWQHAWANSENGGAIDCGVYSRYLTAGIEAFQSTGTQFIRPVLINGMASSNSSAGMLVEDMYQRFSAGCATYLDSIDPGTKYNPCINFNRNVDNQQGTEGGLSGAGGRFVRPIIIQDGPVVDAGGGWFLMGIAVDTPNVTVEGGYYLVPDMDSANESKSRTPTGFLTYDGTGCVVDGFTSWGFTDPNAWAAQINVPKGTVRNSKALLIEAAIQENNDVPGDRPDVGPFPEHLLIPPPMADAPPIEQPPPIEPVIPSEKPELPAAQIDALMVKLDATVREFFTAV